MQTSRTAPSSQATGGVQSGTHLREGWLQEAASHLMAYLQGFGIACPPVRVSCGFPSKKALSARSRVIGQCFDSEASTDGKPQLFISPVLADSIEVLGTLLHELLHAAVGCEHGHGKPFSRAARQVGLTGKPTATTVGPALRVLLEEYVQRAGPYPHAAIRIGGPSSQGGEEDTEKPGSRLRLYECQCEPPVKIRVASDSFKGQCLICNQAFERPASQ